MKTDLVVAGFIFKEDKVLLIHHKKLNKWLPPGGHINKDETPDEALIREIKEETNLDVEIINKSDLPLEGDVKKQLALPFYINVHSVDDHDHCCLFYLCNLNNKSELNINRNELKNFNWFSLEDLKKEIVSADVSNIAKKAFGIWETARK